MKAEIKTDIFFFSRNIGIFEIEIKMNFFKNWFWGGSPSSDASGSLSPSKSSNGSNSPSPSPPPFAPLSEKSNPGEEGEDSILGLMRLEAGQKDLELNLPESESEWEDCTEDDPLQKRFLECVENDKKLKESGSLVLRNDIRTDEFGLPIRDKKTSWNPEEQVPVNELQKILDSKLIMVLLLLR